MRRVLLVSFLAVLIAFGGTAWAIPFTDTVNPAPDIFLAPTWQWDPWTWVWGVETYSFTHDITDSGFDPALYTVTQADIALSFWELGLNGLPSYLTEYIQFTFDGTNFGQQEIDWGVVHFSVIGQLQDDGTVNVLLSRISGNVHFDSSKLAVEASMAVPEPTTMMLLGVGLLGLGVYRRMGKKR